MDFNAKKEELLERHGGPISNKDVLSSALYPKVFDDYRDFRDKFGPVDKIDTPNFLVGPDIADEITVSSSHAIYILGAVIIWQSFNDTNLNFI